MSIQITIKVPDNCELKQDGNTYTIVEKEKVLTYEDIARELFPLYKDHIYITVAGDTSTVQTLSTNYDTIEKYGAAIITEDEDGQWRITRGIAVEHGVPSCSAENNDNIEFVHNAEGGKE